MSESSTKITDYELAGVPTTIDQIGESAPTHVRDSFSELSPWNAEVTINQMGESLLVGGRTDDYTEAYRLYHNPDSNNGLRFAGILAHSHSYTDEIADRIGFAPAGESPDEDVEVDPVTILEATEHDRTERLDILLPHIRTEITDSDWVNGRGDTSYPEWGQAVRRMAEFMAEELDTDLAFSREMLRLPRVEHALGRYPMDSDSILTQLSNTISQKTKLEHHEESPEAFRELLFEFAAHHDLPGDGK